MGNESTLTRLRVRRILLVIALFAIFILGCSILEGCQNMFGSDNEEMKRRHQQQLSLGQYQQQQSPAPEPEPAPPSGEAPSAAAEPAIEIGNTRAVQNGGTPPTWVTDQPMKVTEISTYHWNDGKGKTPGTLGLKAADGTEYGPWPTTGLPGQGGVPNASWVAKPNEVVPPGSYKVVDSDPGSWSQNSESGGEGFTTIIAAPAR